MNGTSNGLGVGRHFRPLCCRYLLVRFEALYLWVRTEESVSVVPVRWALGALADGQCDVLGAWVEPFSGVLNWHEVFDDLAARGVERIRFIVTAEPDAVSAAYPHATVLNSVAPLLRPGSMLTAAAAPTEAPTEAPTDALSPRLLRVLTSADEAARKMQAQLIRVVRRHGSFADCEAAVAFLAHSLERSERGLGTGLACLPGLPPSAVRRVSVLTSGSVAAAPAI